MSTMAYYIRCPQCGKALTGEFEVGQSWPRHLYGSDGLQEDCTYPAENKIQEADFHEQSVS